MVENLNKQISLMLKSVIPEATIYDELVNQKFKTPAFIITCFNVDRIENVNKISTTTLNYDISFFSDQSNLFNDYGKNGINLMRKFNFIDKTKVTNKKIKIIDDILHFQFELNIRELATKEEIIMGKMELNNEAN